MGKTCVFRIGWALRIGSDTINLNIGNVVVCPKQNQCNIKGKETPRRHPDPDASRELEPQRTFNTRHVCSHSAFSLRERACFPVLCSRYKSPHSKSRSRVQYRMTLRATTTSRNRRRASVMTESEDASNITTTSRSPASAHHLCQTSSHPHRSSQFVPRGTIQSWAETSS